MPIEVILPRVDMDMETRQDHRLVRRATATASSRASRCSRSRPTRPRWRSRRRPPACCAGAAPRPARCCAVGAVIGQIFAPGEEATSAPGAGLRATPKARRLAREAGVDLASLKGGGPQGRVQARDVRRPRRPGAAGAASRVARARARAPLVLLHGFGADLNVWRRWIAHLPPGRGALGAGSARPRPLAA